MLSRVAYAPRPGAIQEGADLGIEALSFCLGAHALGVAAVAHRKLRLSDPCLDAAGGEAKDAANLAVLLVGDHVRTASA